MALKTDIRKASVEQLKDELKELKSLGGKKVDEERISDLAKAFAAKQQWDNALESFQVAVDPIKRNLLIADLIEEFLIPARQLDQAKKFAKFLTPTAETQPLVMIRIALAENNKDQAKRMAESLPSPLSRNFALLHIAEHSFMSGEKNEVREIVKKMLDNARTILDAKTKSYLLREIAIDLLMANHEKDLAKEVAAAIPDEKIKKLVLSKIG